MRGIDFLNLKHLPEGSLLGLFSGREHWWTSFFIGALYLASVRAGGCHFCTFILTSEQWQVNSPTPWTAPSDVAGEQGASHTMGTALGPALPCAVLDSPLVLPRNECRPFVFCTFPLLPFTTDQLGTRIFTYCCHLITTHSTSCSRLRLHSSTLLKLLIQKWQRSPLCRISPSFLFSFCWLPLQDRWLPLLFRNSSPFFPWWLLTLQLNLLKSYTLPLHFRHPFLWDLSSFSQVPPYHFVLASVEKPVFFFDSIYHFLVIVEDLCPVFWQQGSWKQEIVIHNCKNHSASEFPVNVCWEFALFLEVIYGNSPICRAISSWVMISTCEVKRVAHLIIPIIRLLLTELHVSGTLGILYIYLSQCAATSSEVILT